MTVPVTKNRYSMGFSLIEIAIVLVIIALLASMALPLTAAYLNQQRRQATLARQAAIEAAINLFVSQNQRLPCPADGALPSSNANYGKENIVSGVCSNQAYGVVPFAALGISTTDGTDGWGNFFTYRVDAALTSIGAMNFTSCSPAGLSGTVPLTSNPLFQTCDSTCSASNFPINCTKPTLVTASHGLRIVDANGNPLADPAAMPSSTGAAYVLISHGENQLGSCQPEGGYINSGNPGSGEMEKNNYAALPYGSPLAYVDAAISYGDGTTHFDDFVLRPSILTVAIKAQLGPRAY